MNQENGSLPFNFIVDDIIESMAPDFYDPVERRGRVDLYELRLNDQSIIADDGVHTRNGQGYKVVRRWVNTAFRYIYTGTYNDPTPYTEYVSTIVQDATASVEHAEDTYEPVDVYNARILVAQIGDRDTRIALEDRLNAIVFATEPPVAPSNLSAILATSNSTLKIDLNWIDESYNEKGFEIYRSNAVDGIYSKIHTTKYNEISFSDTLLSPNTDYYYKIRSINNLGFSDFTNIATASTLDLPPIPEAPSNLQASASSYYEIQLNWEDNSNNEWGFKLYRSTNMNGPFSEVMTTSYNTNQYADQNLTPDTDYYYKLISFNGGGESNFSNIASARTYSLPDIPSVPSNLVLSKTQINPAINLNWDDNSDNELGFIVERSTGDALHFDSLTATDSNINYYTDGEIQPNTIYYYRIKSYNEGGSSQGSNQEAITSLNESVYINITSYLTNNEGGIWNNFSFTSGTPIGTKLSNLVDNYSNNSNIEIELSKNFDGWGTKGVTSNSIFPYNVMYRYQYVNSGNISKFNINGLVNNVTYNLHFMASKETSGGNWDTKYSVGNYAVSLNGLNNADQLVSIRNIVPDSNGSLEIAIEPNSGGTGLINALVIERNDPNAFTNYYAKANADISNLDNWGIFVGGTGGSPADFNSDNITYYLNGDVTLDGDLIIQGTNSKVIVTENAQISVGSGINNIQLPELEIRSGATVVLANLYDTCNLKILNGDLILSDNSSLNIGGNTLSVGFNGYLNKENTNGKILSNNGSIILKGGGAFMHHLYMDDVENNIKYIELDIPPAGQLQLHTVCNVTGSVKLHSGVLNSNGNLVLISDQNYTANVEKIGIQASLTGDVTYQRFWQRQVGTYGFFYIGTPIVGQRVADWLDDFWIQGVESNYPSAWKNLRTYNTDTDSWEAISSENDNIIPGKGVNAFMFSTNFSDGDIMYENTGEINQGAYPIPLGDNAGWNLIANPYPSAIDWDKIDWENLDPDSIAGINAAVYIWDQQNSTYKEWSPILGSLNIASGQGFFVETNAPSPRLIVSEEIKANQNPTFLRKSAPENILQILMSNQEGLVDEIHIAQRANATNDFDGFLDAHKKKGTYFNVSSFDSEGNELAINTLPLSGQLKVVLNVEGNNGDYCFEFNGLDSFNPHRTLYLRDNYLESSIVLGDKNIYKFSINDDPNSYGKNRFEISLIGNIQYIGKITDVYGEPISKADVAVNNGEHLLSDNKGVFRFEVPPGDMNSVLITKSEKFKKSAVDLWDLVLLRRHLTGRKSFTKPIQYLVADVDHSNSINNEDLYQLIKSAFSRDQFSEWIIVGPEFNFELNGNNKYETDLRYYFHADQEINEIKFTGYIPGDLSATFRRNFRNGSGGEIYLQTGPAIVSNRNHIAVPIFSRDFKDVSGMQLSLHWDSSQLKFEGLTDGELKDIYYFNRDNELTIIWDDKRGKSIDVINNGPLFNLTFIQNDMADDDWPMSVDLNKSFALNGSLEMMDIHGIFDIQLNGKNDIQVMPAYPNPITNQTTFKIVTNYRQNVLIDIYNSIGEVVYQTEKIFDKGVNEWTWTLEENLASAKGLYFASFNTGTDRIVKKIMVK